MTSFKPPDCPVPKCPMESNGWGQWKVFVLKEIEHLDARVKELQDSVVMMRVAQAKSAVIIGVITGMSAAVIASVVPLMVNVLMGGK